jgi:hypothetical protein
MKINMLDGKVSQETISSIMRMKPMFETDRPNFWKEKFQKFDTLMEKVNACETNRDINSLLNVSWTSTSCHECDCVTDVVEFGDGHPESPYYRICKSCLQLALEKMK